MQSIKSRIILGLLLHSHLFRFQLKRRPFDPSVEGIREFRKKTEKAGTLFGKIPADVEIIPLLIADRYAEWVKVKTATTGSAILYFHGGMYMFGSPQAHRQHVLKFVKGCNINALVFDYRLAPEHPFPAALEDALSAYNYLIGAGYHTKKIVFAGDSAGGGLCLATLLAIKKLGKELPVTATVLSPWTDLMMMGKSYQSNKRKCFSPEGCAENASTFYAGGNDKKDPGISPIYGDLNGLPPLHISAGENEILLDDSLQFAKLAKAAGVDVTLLVGKGMCHCYPAFGNLFKESRTAMNEICQHIQKAILIHPTDQ
jgi:acetyl esterase/lipase